MGARRLIREQLIELPGAIRLGRREISQEDGTVLALQIMESQVLVKIGIPGQEACLTSARHVKRPTLGLHRNPKEDGPPRARPKLELSRQGLGIDPHMGKAPENLGHGHVRR